MEVANNTMIDTLKVLSQHDVGTYKSEDFSSS